MNLFPCHYCVFLLLWVLLATVTTTVVLGQDTTTTTTVAPTTNPTIQPTCNGVICTADQYCLQPDPTNNATHVCIPLTYPCGGRTCSNTNETFCSLNTNACIQYRDLCGGFGIVTEEQNCNDGTRYARWPRAGDLSSVSVATLCDLDCDGTDTPPDEGGDGDNTQSSSSSSTTTFVRATTSMVAAVGFFFFWARLF